MFWKANQARSQVRYRVAGLLFNQVLSHRHIPRLRVDNPQEHLLLNQVVGPHVNQALSLADNQLANRLSNLFAGPQDSQRDNPFVVPRDNRPDNQLDSPQGILRGSLQVSLPVNP